MRVTNAEQQLCSKPIIPHVASFVLSLAFLVLAPARIFILRNEFVHAEFKSLGNAKLIVSSVVSLLILARIVVFLQAGLNSVLALIASLTFIWLSLVEHRYTIRPSSLTVVYLLLTMGIAVLLGSEELMSFYQRGFQLNGADLIIAEFFARLLLLVLESRSKTGCFVASEKARSPEDTAGLFSRMVFWWLNDVLRAGRQRLLGITDIPEVSASLRPEYLHEDILQAWHQRDKSDNRLALLKVVAMCHAKPLIGAVIPRLCLIVLRCSQPIIISQAISFVGHRNEYKVGRCAAYAIFTAAFVVYFGLPMSSSVYRHRLNRLEIIMRASLVNLVYEKSLKMDHEGSDAGRVVTIMSTDIDAVSGTGEMLHEAWGHGLELVIGMVLLARKVSWLWPVPLVIIFLCSRVSRYVAQNVRSRTKAWNDATQARNSTLSSILGSMRSIKAMGLSKAISRHVSDLRDREIDSSKHVRRMRCAYNVSGEANALGLFAPVVTVVLFAVVAALRGERLDTNTAFTTIAVLALVTHPANMIMTIVPSVVGSLANIDRIQCFLLERPRDDCRKIRADGDEGVEVNVDDVTVKFKDKTTSNLEKVSLKLPQHSITICAGPTGCGKTTLAKVILGEVSPTQGTVASKHARIGYCDQRAWIPTGTIRDIICAFGETIDEKKYKNVLSICCLDYDLARLSDGDKTVVGSRGVNISGGQRQRLALARLVYSGASIAVLDDTFSALDGTTESQLIENLLGPQGWFRKAKITAFVITNSAQHFHYADQVVLLEHGQIAIQGDWRSLKSHMYEMPEFTLGDGDFANKGPLAWNRQPIATKQASEQASEQDICRSTGDMSLYSYYIRSVGLGNFSLLITGIVLYSLFNTFTTYWFKLWTESDGSSLVFYVVGYVLLAVMAWVATSSTMWCTFMLLAPRSGRQLHESLLKTTVAASLLYFSSTDVGIILNRFSQDISLVDRQLPSSLMALCTQIFKMIAQIVILMQVQRLLLIALPICFILVYLIQGIYLQTSRQLRVLELESHSALYSWFLESTEGILSIRAFDWTKASTKKNFENLEASIRPSYALLTLQCWLALVLNLIVGCISLGVILIATAWRSETSEANVGVSLNLILVANTTLVRLVQSFTELEVSLGAIARLREFETQTAREDKPSENYVPALSWPERGCLKAVNFSAGYQEDHHVLRDVNLHIEQGQKLVICGRTGSGKSTIILGLLRIIESLGTVELDEEALSTIPRQCIRSRAFITVPQEPFFLPDASLGFNLDPTCSASQGMLIEALKSVGIWDVLSHTCHGENVDLLSQPLSSLQALSVGELQLVSMARAIVRKKVLSQGLEYKDAVDADAASPKPILVLDEATSSLDPATEANIYEILEREFVDEGYTALIVAHRISVLGERMRRGQDKVAWVQDGTVVKVGDYEEIAQLVTLPALGDEEEI